MSQSSAGLPGWAFSQAIGLPFGGAQGPGSSARTAIRPDETSMLARARAPNRTRAWLRFAGLTATAIGDSGVGFIIHVRPENFLNRNCSEKGKGRSDPFRSKRIADWRTSESVDTSLFYPNALHESLRCWPRSRLAYVFLPADFYLLND